MCLSTHIMGLLPRSCLLLVVVVLLVPATLAQTCNTDPCVLSCLDCSANDKVPDPENCRGYYVCSDGTEDGYFNLPFECGEGEVFNATAHVCEKGDSCEPCDATSLGPCPYECPPAPLTDPVNIPAFADCHSYYICNTDGTLTPKTCDASMPFFDGQDCQTDETRCCHCHPYCSSTADPGLIADPLDCRKYYLCTTADASKTPTISGTCPYGENFDSFLKDCSASALCVTQCKNVVGVDGCIEPFTCETTGFFARCPSQCTPDYYHCTAATGKYQVVESCTGGTVFHPDAHTCVTATNCPYH